MSGRAVLSPIACATALSLLAACASAYFVDQSVGLRVLATGETRGFLGPCGCEDEQWGGMARRATLLAGAAAPDDLLIDLGNAAAGTGALRELRLRTTFEVLGTLRYDAFVPGRLEVGALDALRAAQDELDGPVIVSANLLGADGTPLFRPSLEVGLPDGRTVLLVGVTEELETAPPGVRVGDAVAAVRGAVAASPADAVVVAAAMPVEQAAALAEQLAGVALVVAAGSSGRLAGSMAGHAEDEGPALRGGAVALTVVGDFGAYVRRVELGIDLLPTEAAADWLGDAVPDDPATAARIERFRQAAIALDPDLVPDILTGLRARRFAGSVACAECHAEEFTSWRASHHARGMATLAERHSARDPDCVPCHLVDVATDTGTGTDTNTNTGTGTDTDTDTGADADRLGVGCEACHGGRLRHVTAAREGRTESDAPPYSPSEVCAGCHRPPEVRLFDFDEAWPKIAHGE